MGWEVPGRTVKVTVVLRVPETVLMISGLLKQQGEKNITSWSLRIVDGRGRHPHHSRKSALAMIQTAMPVRRE